jgi:hypothetical protein
VKAKDDLHAQKLANFRRYDRKVSGGIANNTPQGNIGEVEVPAVPLACRRVGRDVVVGRDRRGQGPPRAAASG